MIFVMLNTFTHLKQKPEHYFAYNLLTYSSFIKFWFHKVDPAGSVPSMKQSWMKKQRRYQCGMPIGDLSWEWNRVKINQIETKSTIYLLTFSATGVWFPQNCLLTCHRNCFTAVIASPNQHNWLNLRWNFNSK